jgi:hypothetical protein
MSGPLADVLNEEVERNVKDLHAVCKEMRFMGALTCRRRSSVVGRMNPAVPCCWTSDGCGSATRGRTQLR